VPLLAVTGGVDHGEASRLQAIAAALDAAGVPGQWLDPDDAAKRWPGLRFDTQVLYHAQGARVDADAAVSALQQLAVAAGARVRHHAQVTRIDSDPVSVEVGDDTYRAGRVVVTAGAWTQRLLGEQLRLPPLRVTQEQPLHFAPLIEGEWPSFIHHRGADLAPFQFVYGMRTPGEGVDVEAWTSISCTYTSTGNEDFVIDAVGNIVLAAGFSGHGFKFAPLVGEMLADLALDGPRPPERFSLDARSR
jgi:sarcosine oxidase